MLSHPSSFRLTRDLAFGGRCREDWGRFSGPRPAAFKSLRLAELGSTPLTQPSRIGTVENWLERGGMSHETRSDETCLFDSSLADRFGSDCIERVVGSVRLVLAKPAAARQRSICRFLRGCEHWHGGGRLRNYSPDYRWWRHLDPTDGWNDDHWSPWRVVRGREHRHGGGRQRDDSPDHGWRCHLDAADERNDRWSRCCVVRGRQHRHRGGRYNSPDDGRGCHLDAADERNVPW